MSVSVSVSMSNGKMPVLMLVILNVGDNCDYWGV